MGPNIAPAPYRFTREEYHRMGEAGLFDGKRVELFDGEIITMSPQSSSHAATVAHAVHALTSALAPELVVRGQHPIVLDADSEPEPDIAICAPQRDEYYQVVELLTDPDPSAARHRKSEVLGKDGRLPLPGGAAIPVADLFPPR